MSGQLDFAHDVLARIRARAGRYDERAFLFVLAALEYQQARLPQRRHVTGEELSCACRDFALGQYGLLARTVLEHWGIHETGDVGDVVFALVDAGILIKQDADTRADFEHVFDFDEAFRSPYPRARGG